MLKSAQFAGTYLVATMPSYEQARCTISVVSMMVQEQSNVRICRKAPLKSMLLPHERILLTYVSLYLAAI